MNPSPLFPDASADRHTLMIPWSVPRSFRLPPIPSSDSVIELVAAEHARGALRHARANGTEMPIFYNLLSQPNEASSAPEETANGQDSAPIPPLPLPSPETLWSSAPPPGVRRRGRYARVGALPRPLEPAARVTSAVAAFGYLRMGDHVAAWLSSSSARQARLRSAMAGEERRLAGAWAALWGRSQQQRRLVIRQRQGNVREDVDGGIDDSGHDAAVIAAAARRVAFLEAYPEQACREQAPMMKAFWRLHGDAVDRAREEATVQRALDFARIHGGGGSGSAARRNGAAADSDGSDGQVWLMSAPSGCYS